MNPSATNTMNPGLKPGDKLAVFEVVQQLASGGMGIVWKGYDRLLGRHVAIKQIADTGSMDETLRERFRREADLQKRVSTSHPNIVSIIDFVDDPRGLFIVMEFVDGPSLHQVLAQGAPIEPLKALNILRDVAMALTAIHSAGIIHRDLKPGNILLPSTGGAKVCDFGLAAILAEQDAVEMGTTQYMAPELFGGAPVDARADIYALGMIAYEMLAGKAAYEETFKAMIRDERHAAMRWMKWHTNPRIAAPALNTVNDMVPPVLSDLVARMMAKDPSQRIATAGELLEAIRRHFSKSAVTQAARQAVAQQRASAHSAAVDPSSGPATAPLPKRSRWPYVLAAVLLIQVLGVGGYFYYQGLQKREAQEARVAEADQLFNSAMTRFDAERYAEARQVFESLAEKWGEHPKLGVGARGYALLCQARMQMAEAEQLMLDAQYEAAAKLHNSIDATLSSASALQLSNQAGRLSGLIEKLTGEARTRRAFNAMAFEIARAVAAADFDTARRKHRTITGLNAKAGSVNTAGERRVLEDLGARIEGQATNAQINEIDDRAAGFMAQGKLPEAKVEIDKGLKRFPSSAKLQDRQLRIDREIRYETAKAAAIAAENKGDLPTAVTQYQEANRITPDKDINDKIAQLRSQLAMIEGQNLERAGNLAAAAAKYEQAQSLWPNPAAVGRLKEMKLADDKNAVLAAGDTAAAAGDFEQAIALFKKALDIAPDPATQEKLNAASVRHHVKLAEAALAAQQLDQARAQLQSALAIKTDDGQARQMLDNIENHARFNALTTAGDEARAQSDFGKAKKLYQQAIELAKTANLPFEPVRQKLNDTEYDHLIAQAKTAIEFMQYSQARALLKTAQLSRNTDQVNALLKQVEDNEAAKKK